ncbi:HSP20 family protein [Melghiribacillus thermohalophilus]|uniref:HSP20 family protein n=1 Tax=Melghiribacillus thermohalophilus TaxID=1324956 RepID=A0A4R3N4C2_9BACI|nr:Hsp20/alpha crystallin family protein [Melghiribacillus thermohalophilus]TCT23614.1 HSP20 family protein [Melghiribacillus thermohalophilus]
MNKLPDDPFQHLGRIMNQVDRFFHDVSKEMGTLLHENHIEMEEREKEYIITCSLPHMIQKDHVQLHIENHVLFISAHLNQSSELKNENMLKKSSYASQFRRMIPLPPDALTEEVHATLNKGVLTVRIPKSGKDTSKVIDIDLE